MASRQSFRDRALVIRSYDFGEADRVVVLLTRDHGLVRGVAKGVRRARSRFGSRLQPFVDLDVQLYPGRNLYSITQADTVGYYGSAIIDDFERFAAACAALESAERLCGAGEEGDSYLYEALVSTLSRLRSDDPVPALDAFLLQAMAHSGWAPSLFDCAQCQRPGPHHAFHPAVGGAVCHACRPQGAAEVDPESLHFMWCLAHGTSMNATREQRHEAHQLTRAHLQWHLERRISALAVLDQ